MSFVFDIPTPLGTKRIELAPGSSAIFVGANGGGKTRLAVHVENALREASHRISAHRALSLNTNLPKVKENLARAGLRYGYAHQDAGFGHRQGHRWGQDAAVALLSDFDHLIQALFAEQTTRAYKTHANSRQGILHTAEASNLERLVEIWDRLLPHRKLILTGDDVFASVSASGSQYSASAMSDGERAIFYMIGQALTAEPCTVLIVDEPELHVHRSIMSKLWDEIEAARPDCGFVFITHDLEFAALRIAQKFIIRDFDPAPTWVVDEVPDETGFTETDTTLILGSRRPILFVEGKADSLDAAVFRGCFPEWTVMPRGGCEAVIHSVVTLRKNSEFTRITCSGVVDADDRGEDEKQHLSELGISVLPVAEVENLFLLPMVAETILKIENHSASAITEKVASFSDELFAKASAKIESYVVEFCKRRVDQLFKSLSFSSKTVADLITETENEFQIDLVEIADLRRTAITAAIAVKDLQQLLVLCGDKEFFSIGAKHLRNTGTKSFAEWLARKLKDPKDPSLADVIRLVLPTPTV